VGDVATRWLDEDEQRTWRAFIEATGLLMDQLDRELQRDAGMPHAYYEILVRLSEQPDRSLRMSELAERSQSSRSRVSHAVARLEEAGWVRRESVPGERDDVHWFVSGEPAQVAVGVEGPWFVLARPLTRWAEALQLQPADRQSFTRDDLLHLPDVVAEAAELIAARRRRSFRWCRTCRRVQAAEWFIGAARACRRCEAAADQLDADAVRASHT